MTKTHHLDWDVVHYCWDNSIPPRLDIDSGDTVVFHCRDAGDCWYTWSSTAEDVMRRVFKGHALTGPVLVKGARPGDVLQVEVLELAPG
ncbi:MAG TPA: acetamidase/formamidase family protein, partial [Chloroflexota bacterium]|nr:acetamidase/formamidase family protein [Chloroflexota bacterium]